MDKANHLPKINHFSHRSIFQHFDSGIWIANAGNFLNWTGFSVSFPLMMLYLHDVRGLSGTLAGTVLAIIAIPSIVTSLIGGVLSDRFGRRRLILISGGISIPLSILATLLIWITAPIWIIVIIIAFIMLLYGLINATFRTAIADLAPPNLLSESFGLLAISTNLGFAVGTGLAGLLVGFFSYASLWGVLSLLGIASFLIVLFSFRESFPGITERVSFQKSLFKAIANRNLLIFVSLSFMVLLVLLQLTNSLSVFSVDYLGFSTAQYGLLLTANGLIIVVFQYPVSRGINWLGERKAIILGSLLFCGYLSLSWFRNYSWVLVTMIIVTLGEMLILPTMSSITAQLSPADQRGRYMGLLSFSQALATSVAPILGGVLLDVLPNNPLYFWGILSGLALTASLGFIVWNKGLSR